MEGKGPRILRPLRSAQDIQALGELHDVHAQLPFMAPLLSSLSKELRGSDTALIGFVGAPWTLAAYSVEGGHSKLCRHFKLLCMEQPQAAHELLDKYTTMLCRYASFQVAQGAQVLQVFESWAHHLTWDLDQAFARPYAQRLAQHLRQAHPDVPTVYFANGGSVFLGAQQQQQEAYSALSLDWRLSMREARRRLGPEAVLAGNLDPVLLYSAQASLIERETQRCVRDGRGLRGGRFVLNLGHGVEKDMDERSVELLVNACKQVPMP